MLFCARLIKVHVLD